MNEVYLMKNPFLVDYVLESKIFFSIFQSYKFLISMEDDDINR